MRILVLIATYQERENIERLVGEILSVAPGVDVLVLDDNSPDGTGAIADGIAKREPRVRVAHRSEKRGLGAAIVDGLTRAAAGGYDCALTMDADFSHHPRYLPDLIAGMDRHDVMIGSRYVPGGGITGWGALRRFMSRSINAYCRFLLGLGVRDCSGNFRCYRLSALRNVDVDGMLSRGYSFQEEMLYRCRRAGCRIGETPIVFANRQLGKSKINGREALTALWILFKLRVTKGRCRSGDRNDETAGDQDP